MSLLWINRMVIPFKTKKLKTNHKRPSPRYSGDHHKFAQKISQFNLFCNAIEETSLFASLSKNVVGSMTVEAAVVLPLVLFFFLNMGCAIELIRLHGNLEFALYDIGQRMTVYGQPLLEQKGENEWLAELQDISFSYIYVKDEIADYLGEKYLEESPLADGVDGLVFLESELVDEDDCVEIVVTYQVAPFSSIAGFGTFRMANKYYGHLWNGYEIPGTVDAQEEMVYVAEYGKVYHKNQNCSYLSISVRKVTLQEAYVSRNANGEKYEQCMRCNTAGMTEYVYITDYGESIHYSRECAGLKRTVHGISGEEIKKYRPCDRCVGGG